MYCLTVPWVRGPTPRVYLTGLKAGYGQAAFLSGGPQHLNIKARVHSPDQIKSIHCSMFKFFNFSNLKETDFLNHKQVTVTLFIEL